MSGLDRALRKVAKNLTTRMGQKVVLRTGTRTYTPGTGSATEDPQDRVVYGVLNDGRIRNAEGVLVKAKTLTVAAQGLYEELRWDLPTAEDRVVIGADIAGPDDSPVWDGGTEYKIQDVQEQWGNEQVVAYVLTLGR